MTAAQMVVTTAFASADDINAVAPPEMVLDWLNKQGFGREQLVFQMEYDVVDCPLLRAWWLTKHEVEDISTEDLRSADWDLISFAHVTDVALRGTMPDWWQPS